MASKQQNQINELYASIKERLSNPDMLSVSPWYDMEEKNETLDSNAETAALVTRAALEAFREAWMAARPWPGTILGSTCFTLIRPAFRRL
jgi:hypothetical protein